MVISNEHRQHPGIMNGEKLPDRERSSGIIFSTLRVTNAEDWSMMAMKRCRNGTFCG